MAGLLSRYRTLHIMLIITGVLILLISIPMVLFFDEAFPRTLCSLDFREKVNHTVYLKRGSYDIMYLDINYDEDDDITREETHPGHVIVRDPDGRLVQLIPETGSIEHEVSRKWVKFASFEVEREGNYTYRAGNPVEIRLSEPGGGKICGTIIVIVFVMVGGGLLGTGILLVRRDRRKREKDEMLAGQFPCPPIIIERKMWRNVLLFMVLMIMGAICLWFGIDSGKVILIVLGLFVLPFGTIGMIMFIRRWNQKIIVDEDCIRYWISGKLKFEAHWSKITKATLISERHGLTGRVPSIVHNLYVGTEDDLMHITQDVADLVDLRRIHERIAAMSKVHTNIVIEPLDDWVLGKRKDWMSVALRKANERDTRDRWAQVRVPGHAGPQGSGEQPWQNSPTMIPAPDRSGSKPDERCEICGELVFIDPNGAYTCQSCGYLKG